jgi:hypothetical protein
MFLRVMRHETVTIPATGVDWKGLGYLVSIISVLVLGAVAWPKPADPAWHVPALVCGMATSMLGMGFRYIAHLKQQKDLRQAQAHAQRR